MDIQPDQSKQSVSDDQELAKALAGISSEDKPTTNDNTQSPNPVSDNAPAAAPVTPDSADDTSTPAADLAQPAAQPAAPTAMPTPESSAPSSPPTPAGDLGSIKSDALNELRPLIDHVDLPADEKYDTYLLLIRSTDDASLIGPAHAAAQNITDEKKKAEALLNIIKEIDYLSHKNEQQDK